MRFKGHSLSLIGSLPHVLATVVALAYNALVQRAFAAEMAERGSMLPVAALYGLVAVSFGGAIGKALSRRLEVTLADGTHDPSSALLIYLLFRSISGACAWLMSIPVLGLVAIAKFGSVHPIGFPHFCASVIVGWLLSTTYSTLLCIRRFADEVPSRPFESQVRATLAIAARVLPIMASGIPIVAGVIFLFFVRPGLEPSGAYRALMALLVAIMTIGGYGYVYCARIMDQIKSAHATG